MSDHRITLHPIALIALLCGVVTVIALIVLFGVYHTASYPEPEHFPVALKNTLALNEKKQVIAIKANVSLEALEDALSLVRKIEPRPIFSVSNRPHSLTHEIELDRSRLFILAGDNFYSRDGYHKYTEYTLNIQGDFWIIEKQESKSLYRN